MVGKNKYYFAVESLKKLKEKEGTEKIPLPTIQNYIRAFCSSGEKDVDNYLKLMRDSGLIIEKIEGWEVHLENALT